jgi:hypothetical protein
VRGKVFSGKAGGDAILQKRRVVTRKEGMALAARALEERLCAHFVLNATTLQLLPATSSQHTVFTETVAGIGWKEVE